jgi:hypothetical protein
VVGGGVNPAANAKFVRFLWNKSEKKEKNLEKKTGGRGKMRKSEKKESRRRGGEGGIDPN